MIARTLSIQTRQIPSPIADTAWIAIDDRAAADAVATARGRTEFGEEGKVLLRRGGQVVDADLRLDMPISESEVLSGDEIFVPRRAWIDLNLGAVVAGVSTLGGIIVTLIVR